MKLYFLLLCTLAVGQAKTTANDHFCAASNTINNTCTIKDRNIRLQSDLVYNTTLNLVFDNSIVRCLTAENIPCSITIN